jgi:predicted porin
MVYRKTRQRVALTLVAMSLLALGYSGPIFAEDTEGASAKEGVSAKEESLIDALFQKITKGFYGQMDVSFDYTTKGMADMVAVGGYGWSPSTGFTAVPSNLFVKMANCNPATGICNPHPIGNVGWLPEFASNRTGVGFRGDHKLPGRDLKIVYQIEASIGLTSAPGTNNSWTKQSNVVHGALGYGTTYLGVASKDYGQVRVGTMYSPYKTATDRMNPFGGMLGGYNVVMGNSGGDNRVEFGTRLDHSIEYVSPKMLGGFSLGFLLSPGQNRTYDAVIMSDGATDCSGGNLPGSGNLPANCDDGGFTSAYSLALNYETKNFYVTADYERHNNVNRNSDGIGSNNPEYLYYYNNFGTALVPGNPLQLDMTPVAVAPANGGTVAPCGTSTCVTTIPLGAYTTSIGPEYAYKVGAQYIFDFGLTVSGIWERLRRDVPSYLQFQNERQRYGTWLALSQQLGESMTVSAGWAHAGKTPGDPGGQHNFNPFFPANTADMVTLAFVQKIDKQVSWYADVAETFNHGNAHYDLGAGGHGITTDCHDGTHASQIDYSSFGPTTWGGCHIKGASVGMTYKF